MEKLELKQIIYKKIDSILNSPLAKKMTAGIFTTSIVLIGTGTISGLWDMSISFSPFNIIVTENIELGVLQWVFLLIGLMLLALSIWMYKAYVHSLTDLIIEQYKIEDNTLLEPSKIEKDSLFQEVNKDTTIININYHNHDYPFSDKTFIVEGGFLDDPPLFNEYLNLFNKPIKPYIIALKKEIETTNLINLYGNEIQEYMFLFEDGVMFFFTFRGWGELVQAIKNKQEGYLTYYMRGKSGKHYDDEWTDENEDNWNELMRVIKSGTTKE